MMIRQRHKKPIAWLLIAAMLLLVLIAPGGMVMANPLESGGMMDSQSMEQSELTCTKGLDVASDAENSECDSCPDSSCNSNCYSCMQVHFLAPAGVLKPNYRTERYSGSATPRLILFGHTPIPRPPRHLLS
jgi:hypothetical protein